MYYIDSAVLFLAPLLYILIDSYLVQSTVSNLFPNQWCCLKLYLSFPVCLICLFWLVIIFSEFFLDLHLHLSFVIFFKNRDLFCTSRPPYILDESDMYVANPDITLWIQSQASLSSHIYTLNACMQNNQSSGCRPKCCYNQPEFIFPRSSFSWPIIAVTAEYSIAVAHP